MRRPRFALLLVALLLPVVILLLLLGRGRSQQGPTPPTFIGSGPARACATTSATARVTAKAPVSAVARVVLPVAVTETASGSRGIVAVTRARAIDEQASASRVVSADQLERVKRRACAHGSTSEAAHGQAFRRAYAFALAVARRRGSRVATSRVEAMVKQLQPAELTTARKIAQQRAVAAEPGVRAKLSRQALAAAQNRAR